MCGRFTLKISPRVLEKQFLLEQPGTEGVERYNIAPSQQVLGIRLDTEGKARRDFEARWGLVPFWAKDEKIGYKMINARAETARTKPAFRAAARKRRCLIPASGFYEWKREGKRKRPFWIHPREPRVDAPCLAMAGLWEIWKPDADAEPLTSLTVLTTAANTLMEPIHDRMPVFLQPGDYDAWLDAEAELTDREYRRLTAPVPTDLLDARPVSPEVNSPKHDHAGLLELVDAPEPFRPRESRGANDAERQQDLF